MFIGFSAVVSASDELTSDDFNSSTLNQSIWTFIDPLGDATLIMTGTQASIIVPAGTSHDVWVSSNNAPRIMQSVSDMDFEFDVKFESQLTSQFQIQGVIVQQDDSNYLRFDFFTNATNTKVFAASFTGGSPIIESDVIISAGNPLYLRVNRQGDQWIQSYSYDGTSWIEAANFNHALTVTSIGPFIGNHGIPESHSPAFTGSIDYFFNTSSPVVPEDEDTFPPKIDLWYGNYQRFGDIGVPQQWVNILGNVNDYSGIASLDYSLNGGSAQPLSIGPDSLRLQSSGDFNVEININDMLCDSDNQVVIRATDYAGNTKNEEVTVHYSCNNVWPETYSINWNDVTSIQDPVQVVDGLWTKEPNSIRPSIIGYDRVVAIGDITWDDYEVTVPITINTPMDSSVIHGPNVGIIMRWQGHYDVDGEQPRSGWWPLGALGVYIWVPQLNDYRLRIIGNNMVLIANDESAKQLEVGVPYMFKMRAQTIGTNTLYSLKVWEQVKDEPSEWTISGYGVPGELKYGSMMLASYYVDASFGDVTIIPEDAGDTTPPAIIDNTPTGTNVPVTTQIHVTFSEAMNTTSVEDAFSIDPSVEGTFGWSGDTMTFTPSADLTYSTMYEVTIGTGAEDMAGNPLAAAFVWNFTTATESDTTQPTVTDNTPTGADVPVTTVITVTFDESMNTTSVEDAFSIDPSVAGTFGWSGDTMTFTPSADLTYSTMYEVTIGTGVEDLAGNPLAAAFVWNFTTATESDTTQPTVTDNTPTGADVPVTTVITVTFDESMNTTSVENAFSIDPSVAGTFGWSGDTMTFTPSADLTYSTMYEVTIGTGAEDMAGNPLAAAFVWNFTTATESDTTQPTVTDNTPTGADVPVTTVITVTFDESMNTTSVEDAVSIDPLVAGTFGWSGDTMTFTPSADLTYSTMYEVTIGTGAEDLAGNLLAVAFVWNFTTATESDTTQPTVTDNTPTGADVPVTTVITVTFDESMNTTSVEDAFSIDPLVAGTFGWSGDTMTFTPSADLTYSTMYEVTIGTGAEDLAGNLLAAAFVWNFTTAAAIEPDNTPPNVTVNTPTGTDVPVTTVIAVTFNESMNTTSVESAFSTSPLVTGSFTWSGDTMTFTPSEGFAYSTMYEVTIDIGAMDLADNNMQIEHSWQFTTEGPPIEEYSSSRSSSSSGGSSGGGTSGEDFYNILLSETDRKSVYKNSKVSYRFELDGNMVKHINFTALNSAGKVAAKVEILNHTSMLVNQSAPHEVYQNLNIWVGNYGWATTKNMAGISVVFTVEKSWIKENNIDESSISLHHYTEDTWHELKTRKTFEDANSLQFEAETQRFSSFAIVGKKYLREPGGEGIIPESEVNPENPPISAATEKEGLPGFSLFVGMSVLMVAVQILRKKE